MKVNINNVSVGISSNKILCATLFEVLIQYFAFYLHYKECPNLVLFCLRNMDITNVIP